MGEFGRVRARAPKFPLPLPLSTPATQAKLNFDHIIKSFFSFTVQIICSVLVVSSSFSFYY